MIHSTFPPIVGKWYRQTIYRWHGFEGWSEGDRNLATREIDEDQRAKRDANLMMADYAITQAESEGWILRLDRDDYMTTQERILHGSIRFKAVRKWLRDFWSGDDAIPLPEPKYIHLTPQGRKAVY